MAVHPAVRPAVRPRRGEFGVGLGALVMIWTFTLGIGIKDNGGAACGASSGSGGLLTFSAMDYLEKSEMPSSPGAQALDRVREDRMQVAIVFF